MAPPTSVPDLSDILARPSSSSTHIAVDMHSPPEEELFAAAEAMREALRSRSRSKGLSSANKGTKARIVTNTSAPAATNTAATASPPRSASGSGSSIAHATTTASPARSSSSSSTSISGSIAASARDTKDAEGDEEVVDDDDDDDEDDDDSDSDSDDSNTHEPPTATTTAVDHSRYPASMTSSVRDHVYEGGLRYHAYRAGKYAFPNDEAEQNRDDMKHAMTLMLCRGAYFYSPVEDVLEAGGAEVLDLGEFCFLWRCVNGRPG